MRTIGFAIGFFGGLLLFIGGNVDSYNQMYEKECFDCLKSFGFPIRFYESGTILHAERTLCFGLIANMVITVCVSIGVGLVCHFSWNKIGKVIR